MQRKVEMATEVDNRKELQQARSADERFRRTRVQRLRAIQDPGDSTTDVCIAETLLNIESILEVGARTPQEDIALLEEAETVLTELLTIFVYKPSLKEEFRTREEQGRKLLAKLQGRRGR